MVLATILLRALLPAPEIKILPMPEEADWASSSFVSGDGRLVLGRATFRKPNGVSEFRSVLWKDGKAVVLANPANVPEPKATSITSDGSAIVGWGYQFGAKQYRQVLWRDGIPVATERGFIHAISADGTTLLTTSEGDGGSRTSWRNESDEAAIPNPYGASGRYGGLAMTTSGDIVVGTSHQGAGHPFLPVRWRSSRRKLERLALPRGATWAITNDLSADGSVVGGSIQIGKGDVIPVLWDASGNVQGILGAERRAGWIPGDRVVGDVAPRTEVRLDQTGRFATVAGHTQGQRIVVYLWQRGVKPRKFSDLLPGSPEVASVADLIELANGNLLIVGDLAGGKAFRAEISL